MAVSDEFHDFVLEQLEGLGHLTSKRMFGGVGIWCDGTFFALIAGNTPYLKVDDSNRHDFEERGMEPFRVKRRPGGSGKGGSRKGGSGKGGSGKGDSGKAGSGKDSSGKMDYYAVPAEVLEDADELKVWGAAIAPGRLPESPRPLMRSARVALDDDWAGPIPRRVAAEARRCRGASLAEARTPTREAGKVEGCPRPWSRLLA